eukprot:6128056-Prymnesium_polylepis.1
MSQMSEREKRISRIQVLKQQSKKTGAFRSTILKHLNTNRLTNFTMIKEKDERKSRASGPSDSFTARFFDADSGQEYVVPLKRSGRFDDLKRLICSEFGYADCE